MWFCNPPSLYYDDTVTENFNWISSISSFFFFFTGPSCWNFNKMSKCKTEARGGKKVTTKRLNRQMINTYSVTTERIYICKSTFVLIIDALEWKQQQRGSMWSTNNCPTCTQHIPLIYYLKIFTCAINMHEYMSL